ncbi:MAG: hypothetical protein NTZ29_15805 [Verrucomicrobia bacterium]|nr:hypothetical protein [Verrucomicrobiota bacterium]
MELTASEIDRAISHINEVIRENLRCDSGDWSWLDKANEDNWLQALEEHHQIEVPSAFTRFAKPIIVRRVSANDGGAA